jgi:hypothetical protein
MPYIIEARRGRSAPPEVATSPSAVSEEALESDAPLAGSPATMALAATGAR